MNRATVVARQAEGEKAALGPRSRVRRQLRRLISIVVRVLVRLHAMTLARSRPPDHFEFLPPASSPSEFADLAGRAGWYLADLRLPLRLEGPQGARQDAPWLEGRYVERGLAAVDHNYLHRTAPHRLLHRALTATTVRCLLSRAPVTVVDPDLFSAKDSSGYNSVRLLYRSAPFDLSEGFCQFLDLVDRTRDEQRRALVVATGPSVAELNLSWVREYDVRITCNSAVRNHDFLKALQPHMITFADPVFHTGPSRYASAFRDDVCRAAESTGALLLVREEDAALLLHDLPELRPRVVGFRTSSQDWTWPQTDADTFLVRGTDNVLTLTMLPAAFATATEIHIAGSDGRAPDERYFWRHNRQLQYSDELMRTVFTAHPGFFRDRIYGDYYERHCKTLESLLAHAEDHGRRIRGLTSSYIPALQRRGSPPPA